MLHKRLKQILLWIKNYSTKKKYLFESISEVYIFKCAHTIAFHMMNAVFNLNTVAVSNNGAPVASSQFEFLLNNNFSQLLRQIGACKSNFRSNTTSSCCCKTHTWLVILRKFMEAMMDFWYKPRCDQQCDFEGNSTPWIQDFNEPLDRIPGYNAEIKK